MLCLYDLLNAVPELITKNQVDLLEPLAVSLKDVSETLRISVAQVYGIVLAYGLSDDDFNRAITEMIDSMTHKSLENRHGIILVLGHAFSMKIRSFKGSKSLKFYQEWKEFIKCLQLTGMHDIVGVFLLINSTGVCYDDFSSFACRITAASCICRY